MMRPTSSLIGAGATGLPAAIAARETGASVILVEAQGHTGGHAICSGGNISFGGGNSYQKKYGIEDSPDLLFRDLIDWSVVEPNGAPRLPLQRSRNRPRVRRQCRRGLRFPARPRRKSHRSGAGQSQRTRDRHVGTAHAALCGHGLADDPDRQAHRAGTPGDDIVRQRADAAASRRRTRSRREDSAPAPDDRRFTARPPFGPRDRHRGGS